MILMQLDLAGGKVDSSSVCDGEFSFFLGIFVCSILFCIFIFFHEFFDSFFPFNFVNCTNPESKNTAD